jgi:hypothetical protein
MMGKVVISRGRGRKRSFEEDAESWVASKGSRIGFQGLWLGRISGTN